MPKYNPTPKMRPHKLDNITLALQMVQAAKVKTNFLKSEHLIDHDLKMLLGMVWAIILDYSIKGISVEEMTAKEGLLLWCRKKTAGYKGVDPPSITNFTTNWNNGLALAALIHRHQPDKLDYDSLDQSKAKENIEKAMAVAESLGIPRLMDVEDLAVERPDERSVMTYVSEFFHRFAAQDVKEKSAGRLQRFIKFLRNIQERANDYEKRARALIDACNAKTKGFSDAKLGDTLILAVEDLDKLKKYYLNEKPPLSAERLDVESLFAEIQTELKVNGRAPYIPPNDLSPEAIDAAFDVMNQAEKTHAKAARENRFRFVAKVEHKLSDDKLAEFEGAFNHFDVDKDGSLDKLEFKAALHGLGIPFKSDQALDVVWNSVKGDSARITKDAFINYLKTLHEDKDTPEEIKAAFAMLADQGKVITAAQLNVPPLSGDDIAFATGKMEKTGDNTYDFGKWVDSSFKA